MTKRAVYIVPIVVKRPFEADTSGLSTVPITAHCHSHALSDASSAERRAQQPTRAEGELLAVFVPGKLANPLNGTPWIWQKRTRYTRAWKERVYEAIWEAIPDPSVELLVTTVAGSRVPKRVEFLASLHNRMDGDGLQAALKPIRDALVSANVISGDADKDGHTFHYAQRIDRACRGVEIRVRLA